MCLLRLSRRLNDMNTNRLARRLADNSRSYQFFKIKGMMGEFQRLLDANSSIRPGQRWQVGGWRGRHPGPSWAGPVLLLADARCSPRSLQCACPPCRPLHGGLCPPGCHLPACTSEQEGGREREGSQALHSCVLAGHLWPLSAKDIYDSTPVLSQILKLWFTRKIKTFH